MLTKDDLQQMRSIVREEVGNEAESIKDALGSDIRFSNLRLRESIDELKDRIKNLEIWVRKMNNGDSDKEDL